MWQVSRSICVSKSRWLEGKFPHTAIERILFGLARIVGHLNATGPTRRVMVDIEVARFVESM